MHRLLYLFFLFSVLGAAAQQMPERSAVRKGNRKYDKGAYEEAIGRYEEALRLAPGNFEATYDLGNALYKAERYDKATETPQGAAADSLRSDAERAQAFYNLGNALFKQQKLQEALESYKQSLRLNPSDEEAKYNYAYTQRLLAQRLPRHSLLTKQSTALSWTPATVRTGRIRTAKTIRTRTTDRGRTASRTATETLRSSRTVRTTPTRAIRTTGTRTKARTETTETRALRSPFPSGSRPRNRSRCSTPSRPRRTRRRTSSRRRRAAPSSAEGKTGKRPLQDLPATSGPPSGRRALPGRSRICREGPERISGRSSCARQLRARASGRPGRGEGKRASESGRRRARRTRAAAGSPADREPRRADRSAARASGLPEAVHGSESPMRKTE